MTTETNLNSGQQVFATDGQVGVVGEAISRTEGQEVTHFTLLEGKSGKNEIILPVSAIDKVEGNTVHLRLEKSTVEMLPATPGLKEKDGQLRRVELIAKVFDGTGKAAKSLEFVKELHQQRVLRIRNAAILVRDEDGTATITDTKDLKPGKSRIVGAITGGLVGILGGPLGVVIGAAAGLGAGSLAASQIDKGFSNEFLEALEEKLGPGKSALVLVVEDEWIHSVTDSLGGDKGFVVQQDLIDAVVEGKLQ